MLLAIDGFGDVGGKVDPVLPDSFGDELRDPRFVEWHIALLKPGDPFGVCIHTGHVDAELRKAGSCY
jgi:hypothetical protein